MRKIAPGEQREGVVKTPLEQFKYEFRVILQRMAAGQTMETNLAEDMDIDGFREEVVDIWMGFRALIVHLRTTPKENLDFKALVKQVDDLVAKVVALQHHYAEVYLQGKDFKGRFESQSFLGWILNKLTPFKNDFDNAVKGEWSRGEIDQYLEEDLNDLEKNTLGPDLFK